MFLLEESLSTKGYLKVVFYTPNLKGKYMGNVWAKRAMIAVFVVGLCMWAGPIRAEEKQAPDDPVKEQLAKETEEACAASAKDKPTPEMIIKKVEEACVLLEKEGKAAFPKFKGKDSKFIFAGTYLWVNDQEGVLFMHAIKYKMEGKRLLGLKDANGKLFYSEFNRVAREKKAGWVDYVWPKPGQKEPSKKVAYVKACKIDGVDMVVG